VILPFLSKKVYKRLLKVLDNGTPSKKERKLEKLLLLQPFLYSNNIPNSKGGGGGRLIPKIYKNLFHAEPKENRIKLTYLLACLRVDSAMYNTIDSKVIRK